MRKQRAEQKSLSNPIVTIIKLGSIHPYFRNCVDSTNYCLLCGRHYSRWLGHISKQQKTFLTLKTIILKLKYHICTHINEHTNNIKSNHFKWDNLLFRDVFHYVLQMSVLATNSRANLVYMISKTAGPIYQLNLRHWKKLEPLSLHYKTSYLFNQEDDWITTGPIYLPNCLKPNENPWESGF